MKKILFALLAVTYIAMAGCSGSDHPEAEAAAVESASAWLSLVDNEKYKESWDTAAAFFKGTVPEPHWIATMASGRKPFGKTISRELESKEYHTSQPGAPDGEYVVIQFKTSFANKKDAVETITPMREKDGTWRVSGYYIK